LKKAATGGRAAIARPVVAPRLRNRWSRRDCATGGRAAIARPVVAPRLRDHRSRLYEITGFGGQSKRLGGRPVTLESVVEKARREAGER